MGDATSGRVGQRLNGKYELEQLLGSGGMGQVYRARNLAIGRTVAIKALHPELACNRHVLSRFLREAKAAHAVRHRHVVEIIDVDRDEQGVPFIVQEYLEGEDLASTLARRAKPLSALHALKLLIPVVDAIGVAHAAGIVHRDLKPENVFLAKLGGDTVPKVLDFGISKMLEASGDTRLTRTHAVLGSPAYMSPEQIDRPQQVDERSDVWAIGVMLYELLAGRVPFEAPSTSALFLRICTSEAEPLQGVVPAVDAPLAAIVHRCLHKDRKLRYRSAVDLLRVMEQRLRELEPVAPEQRDSLRPVALGGAGAHAPLPPATGLTPRHAGPSLGSWGGFASRSGGSAQGNAPPDRAPAQACSTEVAPVRGGMRELAAAADGAAPLELDVPKVLAHRVRPMSWRAPKHHRGPSARGFAGMLGLGALLSAMAIGVPQLGFAQLAALAARYGTEVLLLGLGAVAVALAALGYAVLRYAFDRSSVGMLMAAAGLALGALCVGLAALAFAVPGSGLRSWEPLWLLAATAAAVLTCVGLGLFGLGRAREALNGGLGGALWALLLGGASLLALLAAVHFVRHSPPAVETTARAPLVHQL